jgi:CRP-like cAMP-binding protein
MMKCPLCHAELAGAPNYCGACGHNLNAAAAAPLEGTEEPKLPTGFSRTLSTDLVTRQIEMRTQSKLATLVENRTYKAGEVMIRQGETSRDLFVLNEGVVEISRNGADGEVVLNEIEPPYILGDVAFLFGMPRTATARAKTEVKVFVVRYDDLKGMLKELPPWVHPLLTALASDMKSLHYKSQTLEKRVSEIEAQAKAKT